MTEIHGFAPSRFSEVKDAFAANFAETLTVLVMKLGGKRPRAHARGVSLHQTKHVTDLARPDAGAGRGLTRRHVR